MIAASLLASALVLRAPTVSAQQLPFRHYGVADGLAHNQVGAIHQDAQGYLWFGTSEGLSRFDGYRFTNYGLRDGLPNFIINVIIEDRQGRLWVGTNGGGVAWLVDQPQAGQSGATERKSSSAFRWARRHSRTASMTCSSMRTTISGAPLTTGFTERRQSPPAPSSSKP